MSYYTVVRTIYRTDLWFVINGAHVNIHCVFFSFLRTQRATIQTCLVLLAWYMYMTAFSVYGETDMAASQLNLPL